MDQVLTDMVRYFIKSKVNKVQFIVWFLRKPDFPLSLLHMRELVGGAKQALM